jgi:hypothetical protein
MDSLDPLPRHPRAKPSCSNRMTEPAAGSAQVASTSGLGATKDGYCVKKNALNQCLNYASSQRLRKACPRVLENVMVSFGTINCNFPIIRDGLRFRPHAILAECHLTGTKGRCADKTYLEIWSVCCTTEKLKLLFDCPYRMWIYSTSWFYLSIYPSIFLSIHLFTFLFVYFFIYLLILYKNKLRWYPQQPQRFIFTNLSEACCEAKRWKHLSWVSVC